MTVDLILTVLALICFGAAAVNVRSQINLIALGLFFWLATTVV
jgi:hypothetical protein